MTEEQINKELRDLELQIGRISFGLPLRYDPSNSEILERMNRLNELTRQFASQLDQVVQAIQTDQQTNGTKRIPDEPPLPKDTGGTTRDKVHSPPVRR